MDRYEAVVGRGSTLEERFVFVALAVSALKPDLKVVAVYTDVMLEVLNALNFRIYSDTCRDVLINTGAVKSCAIHYGVMCRVLKEVVGDSYKAAVLYLELIGMEPSLYLPAYS